MLTDYEIRGEYQQVYRYAHDFWTPFIKDAQVYTLGASGYTWSDQERIELVKAGREPIEFNIMRRPLQFYSGYLRDNINSIVYEPVLGSEQKSADQFTKVGDYVWDKGKGFPTFLDAADEGLKSGIALCGLQMDYTNDFVHGDLTFYKRTFNSFYLDPLFEHIDLSDCSFAITRDLVSRQTAKSLLPFVDPEFIDQLQNSFRDDKFLSFHPQFTNFQNNRNIIAYDQYYKRIIVDRTFLVDIDTAFYRDITDLPEDEKRQLRMGLKRFDDLRARKDELGIDEAEIPNVEIRTVKRNEIELNIMLNGQRCYCGEDKTGIKDTYPFVPLITYFEPSIWMPSQRIQGIASTQWFNQRQFNKRHMKIIDMMDSTISTGFKYLLGTVPDPQDMQQTGQNKLIGVDPENNPAGLAAVEQLQGGGTNPALMEYQAVLDQMSLTLANINETMLGIDEKGNTEVSGKLAQVRLAQGLRGNRKVFDNIETAQMLMGGLVLKGIQLNYPPGKIERIIGERPADQFYSKEFEQYDAVIKQGPRTQSQKDAYYYELVTLKRDGIVDVPQAEIVRALHMSGLSDLQKAIEEQDKQKAEQAKREAELQQMQIDGINAKTQADLGLAQERKARVISDLALKDERESEAQQNIAQATLDRAKAMSEISKLNEDRILQVLKYLDQIEQQEAMGREVQKKQVADQANQVNLETEGSAQSKAIGEMSQQPLASQQNAGQ